MAAAKEGSGSARRRASWHFITGEYPPQVGGVSDYCARHAEALVERGHEVHVWAPPAKPGGPDPAGVTIHRLPDRFGPTGLARLAEGLDALPPPRRLFVQYVADAFGSRAMNLRFCLWLSRRRQDRVWVMFHEYSYPMAWNLRPALNFLGVVTRVMGGIVARRAERVFLATTAWEVRIPRRVRSSGRVSWLPVPSNVSRAASPEAVAAARARAMGGRPGPLIGHFGTFHPLITPPLFEILPGVLRRDPARRCLLIGRGGEPFAAELARRTPDLSDRIAITGSLHVDAVASQLRACDVMIQPYIDGVTTRRGTLMAGLALGVPIVTNLGPLSEPMWTDSDVLAVAADPRPASIVAVAERVLSRPETWEDLGSRGKAFYEERFSLARSLLTLEKAAAEEDGVPG